MRFGAPTAAADGVPVGDVDFTVVPKIAADVYAELGLGPRDEIRIQLQTRDGETTFGVLARRSGTDQPWRYFDLDGSRR